VIVAWALAMATMAAPVRYESQARIDYLEAGLAAVLDTGEKELHAGLDYVHQLQRSACRSQLPRLEVECLITATRRRCKGKGDACALVSDLVVTAALAERHFISPARRHEIMKQHKDFRTELGRELGRRQAALALDFFVNSRGTCEDGDAVCFAAALDSYCAKAADQQSLSWQHCAATLVWFVATGKSS
jgi:hypothetical protein